MSINAVPYDNFNNRLSIQFETGSFEVHIIDIFNMLGQKLYHQLITPFNSGKIQVDIENVNYASGAYFVVVSKAGGAIRATEKFVIAH
ncbi:MAG: T9SS type A sorting domain-containing protein [Proteobacteria bacterium]|nr:T9SS type A sorting domain-containing protein [Pseudomonadota bacterium]